MTIRIRDDAKGIVELTVLSFINGTVIGIDENLTEDEELDNYERIEENSRNESTTTSRKRGRRDPADNLGDAVALLDTDKIERGVDFEEILRGIERRMKLNKTGYAEFFRDEETLADYCEYYSYNLQDLIRLFIEHKPEIMTVDFMKKNIKPMVHELSKQKSNFENESEGCQYRRIFAYI